MAAIDSAYQYYLSTYHTSGASRYDTHKKSQLRAVYNNIIKTNKESPLYKIKYSGDVGRFAIDIKEKTRSIQNVVASLSDTDEGIESVFSKKIAQSSDEDVVRAEYIGDDSDAQSVSSFDVEVRQLATPQTNFGHYLRPDKSDIRPGAYSFDLSTTLNAYEFQYTVSANETNQDVQEKLIRLINNSNTGLRASYVQNSSGDGAISIRSVQTGHNEDERYLFEILPSPDNGSIKAMNILGIDHVEEMASNSSFLLNGMEQSSQTNNLTVNNAFALTFKGTNSDGTSTSIGFKDNADAIADNVLSLVKAYNNMIQLSHNYSDAQEAGKLRRDIAGVARSYHNELEAYGLTMEDDGSIDVDRNLLLDAVTAEDAKACFHVLNDFKNDLNTKAAEVSINPMNYVDKLVVSYKNPAGHNFCAPYISSIYSGMMLDQFC